MRWMAALAWRLPPRDSRCRCRWPEEARMGATRASAANAARLATRSGLSPAAGRSVAAVVIPTPCNTVRSTPRQQPLPGELVLHSTRGDSGLP